MKQEREESMDVTLAKTAGFCFGVKRAVDKVYEQIENGKKIYTYGPIIHNDEVVKDLEKKGVITLRSQEELEQLEEGLVIIRSHGVPREIMELLKKKNIECIDMTCPFVKRIHDTVDKESDVGNIVIIGNPNHPEVVGIKGWCKGTATVVENVKEAEEYTALDNRPICIVSQTTFNYNKFQELVEIFTKKGYHINVVNTICDATRKRQTEAKEIASEVDLMIVIGDTQSSNSRKLYEICQKECKQTHFIQTLKELQLPEREPIRKVGITAGASTPNNIIEEVQNYVRFNF